VSAAPANHYSLLKTLEAIFDLAPLGYAAQPDLRVLGRELWNDAGSARGAH